MEKLPFEYQLKFDAVLSGELDIATFEAWVYETADLASYFLEEAYLELISINFKQQDFIHEFAKQFGHHLEVGKIETHHLIACLQRLVDKSESFGVDLQRIYHKSCHGYSFLRCIGYNEALDYLIDYKDPFLIRTYLVEEEVEKLYPKVKDKALLVIDYLCSGKIVLHLPPNLYAWEDDKCFSHTLSKEAYNALIT